MKKRINLEKLRPTFQREFEEIHKDTLAVLFPFFGFRKCSPAIPIKIMRKREWQEDFKGDLPSGFHYYHLPSLHIGATLEWMPSGAEDAILRRYILSHETSHYLHDMKFPILRTYDDEYKGYEPILAEHKEYEVCLGYIADYKEVIAAIGSFTYLRERGLFERFLEYAQRHVALTDREQSVCKEFLKNPKKIRGILSATFEEGYTWSRELDESYPFLKERAWNGLLDVAVKWRDS